VPIAVGWITFDTPESERGIVLAHADSRLAPLLALVNGVAGGVLRGYAEALEAGWEIHGGDVEVARADVASGASGWRELSGADGTPPYYEVRANHRGVAVPAAVVLDLIERLLAIRLGENQPWLFTPRPRAWRPGHSEEATLTELERQARELDTMTVGAQSAEELARVSARRRFVFLELEASGVFTDDHASERLRWLDRWQAPTVAAYQRAAISAWRYYRSELRKECIPDANVPTSLLGASLSIDWFRLPSTPPEGWNHERLSVSSEFEFLRAASRGGLGPGGTFYFHSGRLSAQYFYRWDDGVHPSLYRARVRRG
jgi:hypothetical protein